MSSSWDDLMTWKDRISADVATIQKRHLPSGDHRRFATIIEQNVNRAGKVRVAAPLRNVLASLTARTTAVYTHSWSASYTTGGEAVTLEGDVDTFELAVPVSAQGYTFDYNSATDKLLAYDGGGAEVAAGVNLETIIGTTKVLVIGTDTTAYTKTTLPAYLSSGDEVLSSVTLTAEVEVTQHATNYWTIQAFRRKQGQDYGEYLGDAFATTQVGLEAGVPHTLYTNRQGLALEAGDMILVEFVPATNDAAEIERPVMALDIQRVVT